MQHDLTRHFPLLARFQSTRELEASACYAGLRPRIERVLSSLVVESRAPRDAATRADSLRVVAWNIQRGRELDAIIAALRQHPGLREADVLLLTELDQGMARTGNRDVAGEIARALGLSHAFAPCYLSLVNGSGLEYHLAGQNRHGLHGNAVFSRWPLSDAHALALPNGIDKMGWREKRLGCQKAVVATIEHPDGPVRVVSLHLDAHSSQAHRRRQMRHVLDHLQGLPPLPVVVGGDWNTNTADSSNALASILGYWRRILMGPGHVLRHHYPYPERWFERGLFRDLERRGYGYRELNALGVPTVSYSVDDPAANADLAELLPRWCFWFIRQALKPHGGRCGLKLDWLAARGVDVVAGSARVLADANRAGASKLSDHDPIAAELRIRR